MKVMIEAKCSDWDHWKKAYDAHAPARVGFQEDIFVGCLQSSEYGSKDCGTAS